MLKIIKPPVIYQILKFEAETWKNAQISMTYTLLVINTQLLWIGG